jgi:hypothetical protein
MTRATRASWLLAGLVLAACRLDGFMFAGEPHAGPYDLTGTSIPADRYDPEGVLVTAADGTRIHLMVVEPPGDPPGREGTTIFYCHGNAANIGHYWDRVEIFHALGYRVLIFDYRGYGRSEGTPTEPGLYQDADAALAYLLARPGVDPDRIVFYGYSLGAAVCTDLAWRRPDQPAALVLEAPFRSVADLVQDGAGASLDPGMVTDLRFDNLSKIDGVGAPLLVVHGTADDYLMSDYGVALHEAAQEPKRLVLVPGANHGDVPGEPGSARRTLYVDAVTGFLDAQIPGTARGASWAPFLDR